MVIFCKIVEEIIYPSGQNHLINYEIKFFNDDDRKELFDLHKKMMVYERQSLFLNISASKDEDDAIYIKQISADMKIFKLKISEVVKKMQDSWKQDLPEDDQPYFG